MRRRAAAPSDPTGIHVMRITRNATLKQRVFGVIALLSVIPLACFALTYLAMERSSSAQRAMESAKSGAILLERINGGIYAVVMESRGIYMSADWKTAEPFAKNLTQDLVDLRKSIDSWKRIVIQAERSKVDQLDLGLEQFIQFRTELVRLAREVNTAAAREFGDNDKNRAVRSALNKQLSELTSAYLDHDRQAQEQVAGLEELKFGVLLGIAALGILVGALGALFVHRTVIMLVNRMRVVMMELAAGNLKVEFQGVERKDEIGDFARALASFKNAAVERLRLEAEAQTQREHAEAERRAVEAEREQTEFTRTTATSQQAKAMEALAVGLTKIAQGDLTARLSDGFTESYQQLKRDFNATIDRLHETLSALAASARDVTGAAGEISASTTNLSLRTEEQAASLEESSASLEQMSSTVRKNAENAQAANQSAAGARSVADRGGQVVAKAVEAMAQIEASSHRISDIIGVIDEIARQTNLLALNAAVESARAGDAGRGFAVVASEVRSLAQRSSQAANDIKSLITNSNEQVRTGVELVNRTGTALDEIVTSIKNVAALNAEIAAASIEQANGLDELNRALGKMDGITQQNSASVEENAAIAKTLEKQAKVMDEQVAFFKLATARGTEPAAANQTRAAAAQAAHARRREDGRLRAVAGRSSGVSN
jgi:methyl-accepting chemotaxis protein